MLGGGGSGVGVGIGTGFGGELADFVAEDAVRSRSSSSIDTVLAASFRLWRTIRSSATRFRSGLVHGFGVS